MSLFKAREWWSTIVGSDEEFDSGCLCVANIDNQPNDGDKIIVGSFHGFIRIYRPSPTKLEDGWSGFRAEDVLCEAQLSNPILQVEAGRFLSGSNNLHLAILQPRVISIFTVVGSRGQVEHGTQYGLKLAYEHKLKRTSANFCYGPFGGVKGKDFLCVQSMDATVSVFEHDSFAFCRFLPGALLPGPIGYIQRTDSFVTVSSARQLESYRYQVLAVATDAKTKEESQSLKSGKKVAHEWMLNIGEDALDMRVVTFGNSPTTILILGERYFFIVSDTGKIIFMKKLDFNPSCFLPYSSIREGTINTIIGTYTNTLMVHDNITVKWAAQLPFIPMQICVGNFVDLQGVIVTIDDAGHLQCSYLGTDPAMFTPPTVELRGIDYEQQDIEMKLLQKVIKEQQSNQAVPMPSERIKNDVQIAVTVDSKLDDVSKAVDVELKDEEPIPSITLSVQLKTTVPVSDIRLQIYPPPPIASSDRLLVFPSVEPGHGVEMTVSFFMQQNLLPADNNVNFIVSYSTHDGTPQVVEKVVSLPLKLFVKPCSPIKNSTYKLTIDTNKPPVNLNTLFPDLLGPNSNGPGNALGFEIFGGPTITILASKTSQRYRLQCDSFAGIWLLLNELTLRLKSHHRLNKIEGFQVLYEGALPLQEYFEVIDRHFECRVTDANYRTLLSERAAQFRAIQRRLLTRFKDKTPTALANLDTLLDGTYRQLLALADATEENLRLQEQCASSLSAATHILNLLICLWVNMADDAFTILQSALCTNISPSGEQGWEEIVDAAITHLLRTCLAKSSKDMTLNPAPLAFLKDTTKLKKHIALLCDRLGKGAKLTNAQSVVNIPMSPSEQPVKKPQSKAADPKSGPIAPGLTTDADEAAEHHAAMVAGELGDAEVPVGSKFGEKSPRSVKSQFSPRAGAGIHLAPLGPKDKAMKNEGLTSSAKTSPQTPAKHKKTARLTSIVSRRMSVDSGCAKRAVSPSRRTSETLGKSNAPSTPL